MDTRVEDSGFHNMLTVSDIMVYFDHCKKSWGRGAAGQEAEQVIWWTVGWYSARRERLAEYRCAYEQDKLVLKAEARLAAKRAARAEAREIRMKELERQQKE
ncbi:hypothetical protein CRUP_003430, partial [Coryphaenoides rupestris]